MCLQLVSTLDIRTVTANPAFPTHSKNYRFAEVRGAVLDPEGSVFEDGSCIFQRYWRGMEGEKISADF